MATHKPIKMAKRPSFVLGLCICAVLVVDLIVFLWQFKVFGTVFYKKFTGTMWVGFVSASVAVLTWVGTSFVALRNSIKQHTITTLLQMRLSATYMGYADKVSAHFIDYDSRLRKDLRLPETEKPTDKLDVHALRYILNYFEFLAVGISRGDFDEEMLKASLRSILRKNVQMTRPYIRESQFQNVKLYEHLAWLHDRWCPEETAMSLSINEREKILEQAKRRLMNPAPCMFCGCVRADDPVSFVQSITK